MIAKAKLSYVRISARKIRLVANLIRYQPINKAKAILIHVSRRPKEPLTKLLNSAVSNAKLKGLNPEQLFISKIVVDEGPTWKRFRAASFGRAVKIRKRTSHVNIELDLIK
jgi:large subunit ribosomal protein L22